MNRNHLTIAVLLASMVAMSVRAAVTFPRGATVFVAASLCSTPILDEAASTFHYPT